MNDASSHRSKIKELPSFEALHPLPPFCEEAPALLGNPTATHAAAETAAVRAHIL